MCQSDTSLFDDSEAPRKSNRAPEPMARGAQSFLFPPEQVFWIKDRAGAWQAEISRSILDARDALELRTSPAELTGDGGFRLLEFPP